MTVTASPIRSASSWQKHYCETCREETTHHKNACIHCKHVLGSKSVTVAVRYNGREMVRKAAEKLSTSQRYRLSPLTRG